MNYRVVIQRLALQDLDEAYVWAARRAPLTAARWLRRFEDALQTLADRPGRFARAPEDRRARIELRQMLFGKRPNVFRVIFTIEADIVRVLRIRRGQRRFLSRKQIDEALESDD